MACRTLLASVPAEWGSPGGGQSGALAASLVTLLGHMPFTHTHTRTRLARHAHQINLPQT